MNKYGPILLAVALAFGASPLWAASAAATGLDKIEVYAGTWKGATEHFKTPYSKAGKKTDDVLHNDCWRSGDFYACHQIVNGKSAGLNVYTYDAGHDVYHSYAIPPDGSEASSGELVIKGNVWTFPWKDEHAGKTTYFHVVNVFTTPTTIEYRQEYSADRIHWTLTAKGTETKTSS